MIDGYDWAGGREAMLRFGPDHGPVVLVAPPLFEEANRTRALVAATLRLLAERGYRSALPDLPAQGESLLTLADLRLADWQQAFAACARALGDAVHVVAIRGGALVDTAAEARARYHFDPLPGAAIVRDLFRARRAALLASGAPPVAEDPRERGPPIALAGAPIPRALLADLLDAIPTPADRTAMLFPAPDSPHPKLRGSTPVAVWRASEPRGDAVLARALADDIAAWLDACAA